ncbi:MAG: hypothetical protein J5982_04060 [Bacilli bacterium]|nr:hypothetical protein [Bacilli bacterium]
MKENNKVSTSMIFIVFLIFAISMIFLTVLLSNRIINTDNYFKNYNTYLDNNLSEQLRKQEKVDEQLKDIAKNGNYSLNNPYVMVNPYGISPLTAIIIFNTMNKESVSLYINDVKVAEDNESIMHIIPVIGLYNNSNNVITLESSSGEKSTINISTESLNDFVNDFDLEKIKDTNKSSIILMGNINSNNSIIRGFDENNNLNYYLDFDYLSGYLVKGDHLLVEYNTRMFGNTNIKNIILEIDYLGKIHSIKTDTSEINHNINFTLEESEYIAQSANYYNGVVSYNINKCMDNYDYSIFKNINTESIVSELDKAEIYREDFDIALMGEYVSVDFKDKDVTLLMVNKYNNLVYSYEVDGSALIKVNAQDDISLFVIVDNKYYNLLTVLGK